jgi:hypothetical protein
MSSAGALYGALLLAIHVAFALPAHDTVAAQQDAIAGFPGQPEDLNVSAYGGYVSVCLHLPRRASGHWH